VPEGGIVFTVGQHLSNTPCDAGRMKLKNSFWLGEIEGETIAIFGSARLVKKLNGKIELIGGTADDHADAREWCSLFAPEFVFTSVPQQKLRPSILFASAMI
jgi:hypothetical protein